MNYLYSALLAFMLSGYVVHSLPMFTKKAKVGNTSPRYELVTHDQIVNHKANQFTLAIAASVEHGKHIRAKDKAFRFNPKQIQYSKEAKKASNNHRAHLNNVDQLEVAEHTGAVKLTKSPSGKKDIYTAITREHYNQHRNLRNQSNAST